MFCRGREGQPRQTHPRSVIASSATLARVFVLLRLVFFSGHPSRCGRDGLALHVVHDDTKPGGHRCGKSLCCWRRPSFFFLGVTRLYCPTPYPPRQPVIPGYGPTEPSHSYGRPAGGACNHEPPAPSTQQRAGIAAAAAPPLPPRPSRHGRAAATPTPPQASPKRFVARAENTNIGRAHKLSPRDVVFDLRHRPTVDNFLVSPRILGLQVWHVARARNPPTAA